LRKSTDFVVNLASQTRRLHGQAGRRPGREPTVEVDDPAQAENLARPER
jgi:hypothetical protein